MSYGMYNRGPMYKGFQQPQQYSPQQLAQLKNSQIQSLYRQYPNTRAQKPDKSVLDIDVTFRNNQKVVFRVTLAPTFPQTAPAIYLLATCSDYTYLDKKSSRVIHGTLQSWKPTTDLGALCKQIFIQFITYPPTILKNSQPTMGAQQPQPANILPYQKPGDQPIAQQVPMPKKKPAKSLTIDPVPHKVIEVSELNDMKKVKELLKDEMAFKVFVSEVGYVRNVKELVEEVRKSNITLAEKGAKHGRIMAKKKKVLQDKDQEITQMKKMVDDLKQERRKIELQYQPQFIVQKMDTIINKTEREAKDIVEQFQDGEMDAKKFSKQFLEKKTMSFVRKQKNDIFRAKFVKQ